MLDLKRHAEGMRLLDAVLGSTTGAGAFNFEQDFAGKSFRCFDNKQHENYRPTSSGECGQG